MGLGTREILIALGVLLVVAILLDGVRRVRNARDGGLREMRRKQPVFDEDDTCNGELPSGKGRVVGVRDDTETEKLGKKIRQTASDNKLKLTAPFREPQQVSLNLGPLTAERESPREAAVNTPARKARKTASAAAVTGATADTEYATRARPGRRVKNNDKPTVDRDLAVVVVHVMAPQGEMFHGDPLLNTLLGQGMRYGDRKIFHRHGGEDGSGPVLFSMANSVKPGHFDLDAMSEFATPGVTFLMIPAETADPLAAFNLMIGVADGVVRELGGELKDETRSALTRQTIEHYRQRIQDYTRRHISEYH